LISGKLSTRMDGKFHQNIHLVKCYKNNNGFAREFIIPLYFKKNTSSREVIVSRPTWGLVKKSCIQGFAPRKVSDIATIYGMLGKSIKDFERDYKDYTDKPNERVASRVLGGESKIKLITLTDKGKEKARQLLNVKL